MFNDDTDASPPGVAFIESEESTWVQPLQLLPWLAMPFLDEDPGTQLVYFYRESEEGWTPPARTTVTWTPVTFLDEMERIPPFIPFDQDDAWPQRSHIIPRSFPSGL